MPDLPAELHVVESARRARRQELARISSLLHDEVGQILTAAGLELDLLNLDFSAVHPQLATRIAGVQKTLEQAFAIVRALAHQTHPAPVDRFGFLSAIDRLTEACRQQFGGELHTEIDRGIELDPYIATALYDCVREILDNAFQHAHATHIRLALARSPNGAEITVSDDGCGFDPKLTPYGIGLMTLDYYKCVGMVYLKLESGLGSGTTVILKSTDRKK